MNIDPKTLSEGRRYFLLISCLIPRPIAWTLTENESGSHNLAPFSFFNAFSASPPIIGIGFGPHDSKPEKDTLRNIRRTGELSVNMSTVALAEKLYESSLDLPYGESELALSGLATSAPKLISVPVLADCPVSFECRLMELKPLGDAGNTLMLAEIVQFHIKEELFDYRGNVDAHRFPALARLGSGSYAPLGEIFRLPRE